MKLLIVLMVWCVAVALGKYYFLFRRMQKLFNKLIVISGKIRKFCKLY